MRGPAVLGRSVVVAPGRQPPPEWEDCRRAEGSTEELEQAWRDRTPLVIEVGDAPGDGEVAVDGEASGGKAAGGEVEKSPVRSRAPGVRRES